MDGGTALSRVQHLRGLNEVEGRTGGGSSSRKGRRRVEGRHEPQKRDEALTKGSEDARDGNDSDREVCFVCAEPIENFAFGPCGHVTCANCAHRMRYLYKKTDCVFCKVPLDEVVVVPEKTESFEELRSRCVLDEEVGMRFEDIALQEHYRKLRRPTCSIDGREFRNMHQLAAYLKAEHKKLLCEVCAADKLCYAVELDLFDDAESLKRHRKTHPFCQFCKKYVLDSDALFLHLQREHESCAICEQDGRLYEYYRDYEALENHYRAEHYTCPEPSCRGQVFRNAVDLRIHASRTHGTTGAGGRNGRSRPIQMGLAEFQGRPGNTQRENQRRNFQPAFVVFQSEMGRSNARGTSRNRGAEAAAPEQTPQQHQPRQRNAPQSEREGAGNQRTQASRGDTALEPPARPVMPTAPANKAEETARNQQLLSKLRGLLDAADFELFRDMSGRFRDGSMSAEEYFREAESILGRDARTVLPELTALLRDDSQRSNLSRVVRGAYRLLDAAPVERVDAPEVRREPIASAVDSNSFPALNTDSGGRHIVATRGGQQWHGPAAVDSNSFPALNTDNAGRNSVATRGSQQRQRPAAADSNSFPTLNTDNAGRNSVATRGSQQRQRPAAVDSNSFPALNTDNAGRNSVATRGSQQRQRPAASRSGANATTQTPRSEARSRGRSEARSSSTESRDALNDERTPVTSGAGASNSDHESWTRSADGPAPRTEPPVAAPGPAQRATPPAQEEMFPALDSPVGSAPGGDPSNRAGAVWGGAARKVHDNRRAAASASQRSEAQRQQSQNSESAFPALAPGAGAGLPTTAAARRAPSERDRAERSAADFPELAPVARGGDVGRADGAAARADGAAARRTPAFAPAGAARVHNLADLERARRDGSRHFVPKIGSNGFNWDKKKEQQRKQKAKEELAERERRQQEKDAKR